MSEISSEDSDPLMLAFGQACFVAQNLESTLTFLLVLNRSAGSGLIIEDRALKSVESETRRKAARALLNEAVAADEIGAEVPFWSVPYYSKCRSNVA